MRTSLFLALLMATLVSCCVQSSGASSNSLKRPKDTGDVARLLRADADDGIEEERGIKEFAKTASSKFRPGTSTIDDAAAKALKAEQQTPLLNKVSSQDDAFLNAAKRADGDQVDDAVRGAAGKADDAANVLKNAGQNADDVAAAKLEDVKDLMKDPAIRESLKKLDKEETKTFAKLVKETSVALKNGDDVPKVKVVSDPKEAMKMFKDFYKVKENQKRMHNKMPAQVFKAAKIVDKDVPDSLVNTLVTIGRNVDSENKASMKRLLTFLAIVGGIPLGYLAVSMNHQQKAAVAHSKVNSSSSASE